VSNPAGDFYRLFYGASDSGKSLAILQACTDRKGVFHVDLRDKSDLSLKSHVLRIPQDASLTEMEAVVLFRAACKEFKEKHGLKPLVIVEDIHKQGSDGNLNKPADLLCSTLVNMYNEGLINVIYTVSDFEAVSWLHGVSGHSTRLRSQLFPPIEDADLMDQLRALYYTPTDQSAQIGSDGQLVWGFIKDEDGALGLVSEEDAQKLVDNIGSNLGDLTSTLNAIAKGENVDDAIESLVVRDELGVRKALRGESCGEVNADAYKLTAWEFMERLQEKDKLAYAPEINDVVASLEVKNPGELRTDMNKAVAQLVTQNLLTRFDSEFVSLHRRTMRPAFKRLCDPSEGLLVRKEDAIDALSRKHD